jgi:hypothetical protein
MRWDATSLLVRFFGSTSVATLVVSLLCSSPAPVLAQQVEVMSPTERTVAGPKDTGPTPRTETGRAGNEESSFLPESAPDLSMEENADRETASIAENQLSSVSQLEHETLAVLSNHESSFLSADEEGHQASPIFFDPAGTMTFCGEAETPARSITESREPQIGQSAEDPLSDSPTQISQTEALALPQTEYADTSEPSIQTANSSSSPDTVEPLPPNAVAERATGSVERPLEIMNRLELEQEPVAVVSNDEPKILPADEESHQSGLIFFEADATMTFSDKADPPARSITEFKELQIGQSAEDLLAESPTQFTQTEALAFPQTENVGTSQYEPSAQTADSSSSPDNAEPLTPTAVADRATDSVETPVEIMDRSEQRRSQLMKGSPDNAQIDQESTHPGTIAAYDP